MAIIKNESQKITRVGEDIEYWNPCALLVRMWSGTTAIENSRVVLQKIKHEIMFMIQQLHFWVYTQKNWKQGLEQVFVYQYYSYVIHNRQKVETTQWTVQVSINRWMDKQNVVYVYNKILFSLKK